MKTEYINVLKATHSNLSQSGTAVRDLVSRRVLSGIPMSDDLTLGLKLAGLYDGVERIIAETKKSRSK